MSATQAQVDGREQNVLNMRDIETALCPGLPAKGGWVKVWKMREGLLCDPMSLVVS